MTAGGTTGVLVGLLDPLRPEWRRIVGIYGLSTAGLLSLTAIGALAALGVGRAVVHAEWPPPVWWVCLGILVVVRTVLTWREMDVSHALAYRVLARLRVALFDAYARSVPARRREHSGRAAAVAMTDTEKLEFFYAHTVAQIAASVTLFLVALGGVVLAMPPVAPVMLAGAIGVGLTAWACAGPARRIGAREQAEREDQSERLVDALGAVREVLGYGLQERVVRDAVEATRRSSRTSRRREMVTRTAAGVRELILTTVVFGVVAVALGAQGVDDRSQAALLPAIVVLASAGVAAIADAAQTVSQMHPLVASAERVGSALRRPAVVAAVSAPIPLPQGPLGLIFRDVSFTYDDRTPVLRDWSVGVAPGEHVALAGPSGSGKSTVIALAARLWDPVDGAVMIVDDAGGTHPLGRIADEDLRRAVAVVEQDAVLFRGSVRDNLLRGDGHRSDAALARALERVGAHEWITLDDELGEHGVRLSGGQRARLALARALCREPRILIVDEITASLDPESERVISQVLADFEGTLIAASHRRETLSRFARIVRVDRVRDRVRADPLP